MKTARRLCCSVIVFVLSLANLTSASLLNPTEEFVLGIRGAKSYKEHRQLASTEIVTHFLKTRLLEVGSQKLCKELRALSVDYLSYFSNALLDAPWIQDQSCLKKISTNFEASLLNRQNQLYSRRVSRTKAEVQTPLGSEDRFLPANSSYNLPWDDPLPIGTFALTFDDGPHPTRTRQILETLASEEVRATFFVLGQAIDRNPQVVREISQLGHSLGGHTYTHPDLARRTYPSAVREIERGFQAIEEANGTYDSFFRFPYGSKTNDLMGYLRQQNLHHFFWRIDTLDWRKRDPDELLQYATEQTVRAGRGIILFHDIQPQTAAMLPAFLLELKSRGYKIVVYKSR